MGALRRRLGYRWTMISRTRTRNRPLLSKIFKTAGAAGTALTIGGLVLALAAPSVPLRGQGYDILIDPSVHLDDSASARKLMDLSLFTLIGADDAAVQRSPQLRQVRSLLSKGAEFQCSRKALDTFIRADAAADKWNNVLRAVAAAPGADYPSLIEDELRKLALGIPPDLERMGSLQGIALSFYTSMADPLLDAAGGHELGENVQTLQQDMMICSSPY